MSDDAGNDLAMTRRDCLKKAGALVVIGLCSNAAKLSAVVEAVGSGVRDKGKYDPTRHEWVFLFDIDKCIGCGSCVRACERENKVPERYFRTWVERYRVLEGDAVLVESPNGARDGFRPEAAAEGTEKAFFVPKICNHCKHSPCTQLCPVGASFRTPDGVMLVDNQRCVGCGYCVQACPYGSRFIHPETHVASKCTFCYHRITKGLRTACVECCPTGARRFGDLLNPDDEVSHVIKTRPTHVLKPELLTGPHCHYLNMSHEVR